MLPRKYRVHIFLTVIALVIIFYPLISRQPDQQRVDDSGVAATRFFELVDAGQYAQSWEVCAAYLKKEVPREEWIKNLSAVRSVAGKLLDRKQRDYIYTKNINEGIPDGEYMVYKFDSTFQNKEDLTETVTVMLETDSVWRVAGYFIE
ncbi:Protein of unknown function [Desulfuromusa kysingii]|uniref:DUF4019 domain-containing protein n=1 Tax=Desulfuromusa kysingii TaxID=37625 RepID=A0A1H4E8B5_9BACT|nr:DUF4019 domain-containing protein [Desulfuromusa kysingii]SEA80582.1 Protein of unknown function [Desulfuromusa kysingii]